MDNGGRDQLLGKAQKQCRCLPVVAKVPGFRDHGTLIVLQGFWKGGSLPEIIPSNGGENDALIDCTYHHFRPSLVVTGRGGTTLSSFGPHLT